MVRLPRHVKSGTKVTGRNLKLYLGNYESLYARVERHQELSKATVEMGPSYGIVKQPL